MKQNINAEAEILEKLHQKEILSAHLEGQIETNANEREELAEDLMETEKSIMLVEKKLQLSKEMREAFDPNYGGAEIASMNKEIARMELRLKQLKKQQQQIITEMNFALQRRETIATRGQIKSKLNKDKTRQTVSKGITDLKREIRKLNEETNSYTSQMKQDVDEQKDLSAEIEQFAHLDREMTIKKNELEKQKKTLENTRKGLQHKLENIQEKTRLFNEKKPKIKSNEQWESAFQAAKDQEGQLKGLIDSLVDEYPHLSDQLNPLKERLPSN